MFNISIHIEHIPGRQNVVADLLSRYQFDTKSWNLLNTYVPDALWIPTHKFNLFKFYYLVSDLSPGTAQLAIRVYDRLWHSFRPATQRTYSRMFEDFMGFLVAFGLSLGQINIYVLLAFLEFLHSNSLTVTNISNYLAGIRAFFILYALPTDMFKDQTIQMFVKSLQIN